MQRVLIIGSPGAGKSTFGRALSARSGLPLIHLDAEYHLPGWREPEREDWDAKLEVLLARPEWIMDGNYGSSLPRRLARADTSILLDYPTWLCMWRLVRRVVSSHGSVRADAAKGCPERFDWSFLKYTATFRTKQRRVSERHLTGYQGKLFRFRHPSDAEAFLERLS
ncbi:topology modulation protein [Altererythrobacter sp. MF3-039]